MKKLIIVAAFILPATVLHSQNIGVGTTSPLTKLQVAGNVMATEPAYSTSQAPTAGQTFTLINAANTSIPGADSTMRVYDPGGPAGNYLANLSATAGFGSTSPLNIGSEVIIESINLGTGDSLIFRENSSPTARVHLAIGNNYNTPGRFVFPGGTLQIQFKSNNDASVGAGFALLIKRLFSSSAASADLSGFAGNSFFFDTKMGALRSGLINSSERGEQSAAFGRLNTASGTYSIAMGSLSEATGTWSIAMGQQAMASASSSVAIGNGAEASSTNAVSLGSGTASGGGSVALGKGTASGITSLAGGVSEASGDYSTAFGNGSLASGFAATALGVSTEAAGNRSFATGHDTKALGSYSTAMGIGTYCTGYAGTVVGMYNGSVLFSPQTTPNAVTPLFTVGNGDGPNDLRNALLVRKDGRVGIGVVSPTANLHVDNGSDASLADVSGYMVIGDVAGTNIVFDNNEIMARNNGALSTLFLQNDGGGFEIGGSAAKPGGGSWSATSDARLKQNVSAYTDGLSQVLKINPVNFYYNDRSGYDTTQQHVGVLAQELKEVSPYMVSTFTKDSTDYYKVDNSAMTYMLINAVKEQQKLIEKLEARIEKLEAGKNKP